MDKRDEIKIGAYYGIYCACLCIAYCIGGILPALVTYVGLGIVVRVYQKLSIRSILNGISFNTRIEDYIHRYDDLDPARMAVYNTVINIGIGMRHIIINSENAVELENDIKNGMRYIFTDYCSTNVEVPGGFHILL